MNDVLAKKNGEIYNPKIPRYERPLLYKNVEKKTGEKWIDNKPIYRRVINTTTNNVQNIINSMNIDQLILIYGWAESDYDQSWPFPNPNPPEAGYKSIISRNRTSKAFSVSFGNFYRSTDNAKIVLKYTKTTDTSS